MQEALANVREALSEVVRKILTLNDNGGVGKSTHLLSR
jgi:hypothetical protein